MHLGESEATDQPLLVIEKVACKDTQLDRAPATS